MPRDGVWRARVALLVIMLMSMMFFVGVAAAQYHNPPPPNNPPTTPPTTGSPYSSPSVSPSTSPSGTATPTTCPKMARVAFRCPNPPEPSPSDTVAGETIDRDKNRPGSGDEGILGDILPFTGGDVIRFVLLGLLLTAAGALIVLRVRRTRRA